ncbi:gamma-type small acid-soluble spore protein [Alkalicoccobacillus plakortidis]|jgi:small acid-soluble spore protein E (minor gamma-type SASP)|uniref:Small, acid-soluble spore protein gamma-type n=1 Tax=Alkalicoccobacillus plakortidis TaxID=444060 RepID=A0ABT0XM04_9BACI|nr:gamma-type small acid-soluble spore protein [Alkalicoccobacillus plakortidis]MCM2676755.1 gamma-type small acid-soluble spore protein [Alkalicoccobacillus plakortidis]
MENKTNTNAKTVKKQNQASKQGNYNTEFASETDVQEVKKQNQQSQSKKTQQ